MRLGAPISDLLDRVGAPKDADDTLTILKAIGVGLSAGLLTILELADKVGALLSENKAFRYHLQSITVLLLLICSIAIYTATIPGSYPGIHEYRYSRVVRIVAKLGILLVGVLALRVAHAWPSTRAHTYTGYLCDQRRPVIATAVSVNSIFDQQIGSTSAIGTDGSFACSVPSWTYEPSKLVIEGGCSGTVDLSTGGNVGSGCDSEGDLLPVWRVKCNKP